MNTFQRSLPPRPFESKGSTHAYRPHPGLHPDPAGVGPNPWEPEGSEEERLAKNPVLAKVKSAFAGEILSCRDFRGDLTVSVKRDKIVALCTFLRDDPALLFDLFVDLCGVHGPELCGAEFEVVFLLYSVKLHHRIRVKVPLDARDAEVDSCHEVWKGVNWYEREAYDLVGIRFRNHPNLRRLLTHEEFVGHALRKDYPYWKRHKLSKPYPVIRDK